MENQNTGQKPPKSWLLESILVTVCCCLPLGIVGIVNATKVESRFYAGDIAGANQASADAGKWTKIGLISGVIFIVCYILFFFFLGGAAIWGAMQNP
jgi:Interferon-induced transmembrane protein